MPDHPGSDETACKYGVRIAFGLSERVHASTGAEVFDAAVLIAPDGSIQLHYRRISPQWHNPRADLSAGRTISVTSTPVGCAMPLSGDLFYDKIIAQAREIQSDLLLAPFARGLDNDPHNIVE